MSNVPPPTQDDVLESRYVSTDDEAYRHYCQWYIRCITIMVYVRVRICHLFSVDIGRFRGGGNRDVNVLSRVVPDKVRLFRVVPDKVRYKVIKFSLLSWW